MKKPSTRSKPEDAYHHGDLRNALLAVARDSLDRGEYESLSLRELARQAGVTPNAPYRHFSSKDAILAEVAAEGFNALSARFDAERTTDPVQRLARLGDIYTGFAMEHPALYRVMFGAEKPALMEFEVLDAAGKACFGRLVAATAAASRVSADDPLTLQRALAMWSVVHGWSRLAIDGMTHFLPEGVMPKASQIAQPIIDSWLASSPRKRVVQRQGKTSAIDADPSRKARGGSSP